MENQNRAQSYAEGNRVNSELSLDLNSNKSGERQAQPP